MYWSSDIRYMYQHANDHDFIYSSDPVDSGHSSKEGSELLYIWRLTSARWALWHSRLLDENQPYGNRYIKLCFPQKGHMQWSPSLFILPDSVNNINNHNMSVLVSLAPMCQNMREIQFGLSILQEISWR